MELTEDVRRINGVEVHFPYKPYPSQISMMAKIIAGVKNKQNCLLESPTGSGKSLALLCSALAWQASQYELAQKEDLERSEIENGVCTCSYAGSDTSCTVNQALPVVSPHFPTKPVPQITGPTLGATVQQVPPARMVSLLASPSQNSTNYNEDDDFKDSNKKFRTPGSNQPVSRVPIKIAYEAQSKPMTVKFLSKGVDGTLKEETKTIVFLPHLPGQSPAVVQAVNQGQAMLVNQTHQLPVPVATSSHVAPQTVRMESCTPCPNCQAKETYIPPPKRKIPKIYFGTRTHKQIAQIIRELRKTYYKDVKMTILASREHTCIHPTVSKSSSKSEGCKDLLDGPGCSFNSNTRKFTSQSILKNFFGTDTAWDIEDLVALCSGKKVRACPYYVSRGIRAESDIVFCPYNYLVDPLIRKSMEINLKEEIIILDEGHNIEDAARESVSKSIEEDSITKIIKELGDLVKNEVKPYEHHVLLNVCCRLDEFMKDIGSRLDQQNFEQASTVWAGMDIVARLVGVGLGPKDFPELQRVLSAVTEEPESDKQRDGGLRTPRLTVISANVLEALFTMLDFLYREELRFVEDYRVAIVRSMSYSQVMNDTSDRWLTTRKKGRKQMRQVFTLNFWCLNPAVAFSDFTVVRNLVLTSGTLSPMSSFSSELGMAFPISLEANHVIKDSQVWVGSIGEGPNGGKLQATYRNTETFEFQDELGRLVLEVCKTVPHGILCFLPSYKMLEKLSNRWQTTGLWGDMLQRKKIICEPRRGDKADFDDLLKYFYNVINGDVEDSDGDEEEEDVSAVDGALFLAVCRGKVSEGLDFADNNARAVITVGIPFPNFKDIQVELKRKYNDRYSSERGLLSGSDWYEIQAYRALNQALGRCIRHRNDWGALIMIDDRFVRQPQRYIKGLSKWVRNKACTYSTFKHAISSLKNFTQVRLKASETDTSNISSLPTSQTNTSALETPQKLNAISKTEKFLKADDQYDLMTPSKPITSTPHSNQFKIEPPTSTPISSHSPPMSLPNKDINSASNGLVDMSTETATPVVKKEKITHNSTNVDKSTKDGVNKFFKFFDISNQNCSSNSSNLTFQEDVTIAERGEDISYEKQNMNSTVPKSVKKMDHVPRTVNEETIGKEVNNNPTNCKEECHEDCTKNDITNDEEFLMSTPNLFESDMSDPEAENLKDEGKCKEKTPEVEPVAKRPLFRRARAKASKLIKSWINSDEEDNDFKCDKKQDDSLSNGRSNSEIRRRTGSDSHNDLSKDNGDELCEKNVHDDQSEEDNLITRRNQRGQKRRVQGKFQRSNKRSKGVDFLDDCNLSTDTSKETDQKPGKSISCSKCGCVLVTSTEGGERRKRAPSFVHNILGERNSEFLFFIGGEIANRVKPVSHLLEEKGGLVLNSCWSETDQCCVQYFSCQSCPVTDQSRLTVARIMSTGEQSHFTTGMMWLLANTIT